MTHWEYPEAVARFGRQLEAVGIASALQSRGAQDGDLVMVNQYDFEFNSRITSMYIPQELLDKEARYEAEKQRGSKGGAAGGDVGGEGQTSWRPFSKGGFLDVDTDELVGFMDSDEWELLDDDDDDDDFEEGDEFAYADDDVWMSS
jgi:hypothetical protein